MAGLLRDTIRGVTRMTIDFAKEEIEEEIFEKSSGEKHRVLLPDAEISARAARHEVATVGANHQEILHRWGDLHRCAQPAPCASITASHSLPFSAPKQFVQM
eukprot:SAG11_NODE_4986_length_1703_cov_1.437656_1_plen_102_part_00